MLTVNGTELQRHKLKGPVGYTVVGNPTIVDGVMTSSDAENYVRTRQNLSRSYDNYEIVCKCAKRLSSEEIVYCMSTGNNGNLQARLLSNAFRFMPYTFSDYIQITGTFATDVWYWFKVRRTGNTIYASYSTDGVSWSNEVSKTFTQLTTSSNWIAFGSRPITDASWNGTSIDLNETYIKVNGKLWFYQPADTKYIVKDGKLVWADRRIYVQEPGSGSGIDENTVALYHFNGTLKEEVSGVTPLILQSNPVYNTGKFGQSVASDGSGDTGNALIIDTSNIGTVSVSTSYTIDFWMYVPDSVSLPQGIRFQNDSNWAYGIGYISNDSYTVGSFVSGGAVIQMPFPSGFTVRNIWHHIAYVYDKSASKGYGFIDGQKVSETSLQSTISAILYAAPRISYGCKIDEFRMSNVARWTADFTPPTEPYGASTPGAKNYATQNMAPVPAGYTYGTTTTSAIGYVDIPTQVFTPAPEGSTIGRDE